MPINFVWFQLPNMNIYFNKILATASILYILYFFIQKKMLDSSFKESIKEKDYFLANLFINMMRLLPILLIIFAMYNVDNQSLVDGLKYNECKELIGKYQPSTIIKGQDYRIIDGDLLNRTLMDNKTYTLYIPKE